MNIQVDPRIKSPETSGAPRDRMKVQEQVRKTEFLRHFHDMKSQDAQGEISTSSFAPRPLDKNAILADPMKKKLYDASREFQAIFLNLMVKSMRGSLDKKADMLHGGRGQEIFEDMLYDEYAKMLSKGGTFRLGDEIYRQLSPLLRKKPNAVHSNMNVMENATRKAEASRAYGKNLAPVKR